MEYEASGNRYEQSIGYNRCGNSGLLLPRLSLGLWHNFGDVDNQEEARKMLFTAFDKGVTHFDLANNYGTPYGSAEINFGRILKSDLSRYRDELIISSKAGHTMWKGPYGEWNSRKHLMASIDQSLKRLQLDYVDIFYSHRFDPNTPLSETMDALSDIVRQGKALYIGLSKYPAEKLREALRLLNENKTPCLISQDRYNLLNHDVEQTVFPVIEDEKIGFIGFSPLAQGLLSDKYLNDIPKNSRAALSFGFLRQSQITPELIKKIKVLNRLARERGQSLAQMSIAWCLRNASVTSVILGTSSDAQLNDNLKALDNISFLDEELEMINDVVKG